MEFSGQSGEKFWWGVCCSGDKKRFIAKLFQIKNLVTLCFRHLLFTTASSAIPIDDKSMKQISPKHEYDFPFCIQCCRNSPSSIKEALLSTRYGDAVYLWLKAHKWEMGSYIDHHLWKGLSFMKWIIIYWKVFSSIEKDYHLWNGSSFIRKDYKKKLPTRTICLKTITVEHVWITVINWLRFAVVYLKRRHFKDQTNRKWKSFERHDLL